VTEVLLVDDHAVIREALARYLDGNDGLTVVGQAGGLSEGRAALTRHVRDSGEGVVLLCDVSLPDGSGLDLVREARSRHGRLGIVVLTMHEDDQTLLTALDAGASSLLWKSTPADQVVTAIHAAAAEPTSFTAADLGAALRRSKDKASVSLTPREFEVLQLLADGSSIREVSTALFMSDSTAKTHVAKIYSKLGAHNRASAVIAAVRLGLVDGQF